MKKTLGDDLKSSETLMFQKDTSPKMAHTLRQRMMQRLMSLEGQCKIEEYQYLKVNYPKAIILTFLLIVTVLGLFFLKAFAQMRRHVFYSSADSSIATQLYITGNNKKKEIVDIIRVENTDHDMEFEYKKLRYIILGKQDSIRSHGVVPKSFRIQENYQRFFSQKHLETGLTDEQVLNFRETFGKNEHLVQIQNYFQYLFDVLTAPFFILQYFFCLIYVLQDLVIFAIVLLGFTLLTTTINYIMLYLSFRKVKEMAERNFTVSVKRNGKIIEIGDSELVPGDIYQPKEEVPADSVLISGNLYMNQANLTGESNPIGKFKVNEIDDISLNHVWLYDGSKIINSKENSFSLVINTGYTTKRGQIIRKIINRHVKTPDIVKSSLVFLIQMTIVSFVIFFATIGLLLNISNSVSYIIFQSLDYVTTLAPFPVYFNLAYAFSLRRLSKLGIRGTEPEKTVYGAKVTQFCFDKTGTLTQSKVKLSQIYKIVALGFQEVKNKLSEETIIKKLFESCHTVQNLKDKLVGDEIDKEMFLVSGGQIIQSKDENVICKIVNRDEELSVLRINQFSSQFRGMSVLIEDKQSKCYFVFVQGAPETIQDHSHQHSDFINQKIKDLSIQGYRTLGIGFKTINSSDVQRYLKNSREEFEDNIINLGLLSFENSLKADTKQSIQELKDSGIELKMITGDNIYTAIETGRRAGIVDSQKKLIVILGDNQPSIAEYKKGQSLNLKGVAISGQRQENIEVTDVEYYDSGNVFAVDHKFIALETPLSSRISIFARIPPQGKSIIIKKYKEEFKEEYNLKYDSCCKRNLKIDKPMVGMCGDGANDLLALKQADLSVGLEQTDASYGSCFTANNLLAIPSIIRESKNVSFQIVHIVQFYIVTYSVIYLATIWFYTDATYLSSQQLIFMDFGSFLFVPLFMMFTHPLKDNVDITPSINFMTIENHLIVYGTTILMFAAFVGGYVVFYLSDEFQPNPDMWITDDSGFHPYNHSMTMIFLLIILFIPILGFALNRSKPWSQPIYKNILLTIFLLANFIIALVFCFLNGQLIEAFKIKEISLKYIGIGVGFILGGGILVIMYNIFINCFKRNEKKVRKEI